MASGFSQFPRVLKPNIGMGNLRGKGSELRPAAHAAGVALPRL